MQYVMPRKRHVSRNMVSDNYKNRMKVMPRKRHVSRNAEWALMRL